MENHYSDKHSDENTAEEEPAVEFSFILSNLPTRERNALDTLAITTVDAFREYDFTSLFSVRGYGELTVTRLQALQKRIRTSGRCDEQEERLSLQSPISHFKLSTKERNILQLLNVMSVGDFLRLDLSVCTIPKGYGSITLRLLAESKKRLLRELSVELPDVSSLKRSAFSLALSPREKGVLIKLGISTWWDFACCDLHQIDDIPNFGSGTLQSLFVKQMEAREKIICEKIDSTSEFSCDDVFSVFLLELSPTIKEALWHIGVTRISELFHANLAILKYAPSSVRGAYEELSQIQKDFSPEPLSESPLNDYLASTPAEQSGVSGVSLDFLRQNSVNSLQDFIFFTVPKESFTLVQLQFEWRSRYAPIDFLRYIPAYFGIAFRLQKNRCQSSNVRSYSLSSETVKDFISTTFEDLVQFTGGDLSIVREIQTAQYELVAYCRDFQKCIDVASITDERSQGWEQDISGESLMSLPFFDGKPNRGATKHLHESFLPSIRLDKIVRGSMLEPLKRIGISTLGELLFVPKSHLLLVKQCTNGKISGVRTRIRKLLFPPSPPPLDKSTPGTFLTSLLQSYVHSDRAIDILLQRINGKTLENIAEMYGLTRERIRQLEKKCKNPSALVVAWGSFAEVRKILEFSMVKLCGFAHAKQIALQLAKDNAWSEQSCSQLFVEFLLDRITDAFVNHGNGYYSTVTYPCEKCGMLTAHISSIVEHANDRLVNRNHLLSSLLKSCCSECLELPQRITESFIDWKCLSDSRCRRILGEEEIYSSSKRSIQKMVYHILKKSDRPLDTEDILAVVKHYTESEDFSERQVRNAASTLSSSSKDVFLWDRGGIFVHRKYIPVNKPLFALIEERLKQMIRKAKTPYIALYSLFSEYKSECESEEIPSAHALHACLKARDIPGIAFMRSPCVSVTDEKHERKNIEMLENWVAQQQDIVTNKSLKRYAHDIGIDSHRFASAYANMKSLVRYGAGLNVHVDSLGWNHVKQGILFTSASAWWERCITQGSLFARTDELLAECEDALPDIANDIYWTSDLLFSLLSRSESIVTFGNTYLAYGLKNNESTAQSLGDIVVEVLKKSFGGGANLSEVSSYLRDNLRVLRLRLTPNMVQNYQGLVVTEHEIYLSGGNNAS